MFWNAPSISRRGARTVALASGDVTRAPTTVGRRRRVRSAGVRAEGLATATRSAGVCAEGVTTRSAGVRADGV